jgi:hypothetical protein
MAQPCDRRCNRKIAYSSWHKAEERAEKASIRTGDPPISKVHSVQGEIHYPSGACGKVLYIKSTFSKKLPLDLINYRQEHPEFPSDVTSGRELASRSSKAIAASDRRVFSPIPPPSGFSPTCLSRSCQKHYAPIQHLWSIVSPIADLGPHLLSSMKRSATDHSLLQSKAATSSPCPIPFT